MQPNSTKQLKIMTGVLKRTQKEFLSYHVEEKIQQDKIDKMIKNSEDEHEIRQQKRVLDETTQMFPDCKKRFNKAHQELSNLIAELLQNDPSLEESEDVKVANQILQESEKSL
ncbi:hypothetical protein HK099_005048 [Clydaea vesicula]|uniref:Tubulin-specific chaperone A n=1 Tax=Clydaea vesicula TaxID=447962 RepID=A0AAD5U9J4_9FUNG|nr:hypothetical protein HK099_005048 [Clydaea vesicula]KAJ3397213.1 hypothetical protein HDU92_000093 [Lobulomyces angularis]